ncbi:MAG: ATP phosphoribosyltransferase regulatory subunit, partial [Pyrinomonadaceae bacterium]
RSMIVEAELIAAASEALTKLGFADFTFRLNHRQALAGMLLAAGVAPVKHDATLIALDKLDKISREGVAKELADRGVAEQSAHRLLDFFVDLNSLEHAADIAAGDDAGRKRQALNAAVLGRLVEFVGDNELGARGVDELRSIIDLASAAGVARHIQVDPSLARGLSYYTGAIMEIAVKDLSGSLGGGGRYDNLVGMFLGQDVPACGFSLGLERIIVVMTERGMFPASLVNDSVDVLVVGLGEAFVASALEIARRLRDAGMRVSIYPEAINKPQKSLAYASSQRIPLVVLVGEEEDSKGIVTVRDMVARTQERPVRKIAVDAVRDMLKVARNSQVIDQGKHEESTMITEE